jgi:hypothetical protein
MEDAQEIHGCPALKNLVILPANDASDFSGFQLPAPVTLN